ncbi:MAG: RluA family pseudouridine synthase [Clostridia bacterium]|nr:RluA family pseudouridine synthase [Clostridia bacterium]
MKIFKSDKQIKLSKFLSEKYGADLSYGAMQKLFRNKDIKVDGKRINKDITLSPFQEVIVYYDGAKQDITPVFESDGVFVFYKPPTLTSEEFSARVNKVYGGLELCHRLDRNTAGLLVFAKEQVASEVLKAFKDRTIDKYYLAEVYGRPQKPSAVLEHYLVKNSDLSTVKVYDSQVSGSVKIITEYETVEERAESTLLKVKLITGKTHQIRAHLAHIGNFIIGDSKYGNQDINKRFKAKRQRLVAYLLKFNFDKDNILYNINGKEIKIENIEF